MKALKTLDCGLDAGSNVILVLHRHHHLPGVLWDSSFAERRRGWTHLCVEHKEVGVPEIHQSS